MLVVPSMLYSQTTLCYCSSEDDDEDDEMTVICYYPEGMNESKKKTFTLVPLPSQFVLRLFSVYMCLLTNLAIII